MIDEEPEVDEGYVTLVNSGGRRTVPSPVEGQNRYLGLEASPHQADAQYYELKGDVRFFDMSFGYTDADHMVLHDLSLYAKPGQKIAFVGSTGAGKTTITNLIDSFYGLCGTERSVMTASSSIRSKADLRRSLGIVLQDTHLFWNHHGKHRYGKLGRHGHGGVRRSQAGPCGSVYPHAAQELSDYAQRRRRGAVPGSAAAAGYRPGSHRGSRRC